MKCISTIYKLNFLFFSFIGIIFANSNSNYYELTGVVDLFNGEIKHSKFDRLETVGDYDGVFKRYHYGVEFSMKDASINVPLIVLNYFADEQGNATRGIMILKHTNYCYPIFGCHMEDLFVVYKATDDPTKYVDMNSATLVEENLQEHGFKSFRYPHVIRRANRSNLFKYRLDYDLGDLSLWYKLLYYSIKQ